MASVRTSLAISFAEKYSTLVIQFGSSLVVARLLTPDAFGVFAIAYAIVGFAHVIREMGVNAYLVQKRELAPRHIRAALAATCLVAWTLGLVLLAALPWIDALYGAAVRGTTLILLLNFLIMPVSSTIFAVLQREMRFGALLRINLSGILVNSGCAIVLSAEGWGAMGLAWASVAGQFMMVVVAAWHHPRAEHFRPSFSGTGEVFRFGSVVMLSSLLQQLSTNVANLITARFVSLGAMGLFDRAVSTTGLFSRLIMDAVQPLVLPVLADIRRGGRQLEPICLQALGYLAVVTWPLFMFIALHADAMLAVLFGRQWVEAAPLLRLVAFGGLFWIVQPIASPLLISLDRVRLTLEAQAINQAVAVLGVFLAATQGIEAVAAAGIAISAFHAAVWLRYLRRAIHMPLREVSTAAGAAATVTLIAMALPMALALIGGDLHPIPRLLLSGAGCAAGWCLGVLLTRHPISRELTLGLSRVRLTAARRAAWR